MTKLETPSSITSMFGNKRARNKYQVLAILRFQETKASDVKACLLICFEIFFTLITLFLGKKPEEKEA